MKNKKILKMTILAMMIAILLIMMFTPLGYIPIGVLRITTMHIPVIITAILLGEKAGMLMGLLFGVSSIIINTLQPTITSFVFTPFISVGMMQGNFSSPLIAIVPRVLLGLSTALVYKWLKRNHSETMAISLSALIGTLTNTILVLSGIYLFFGPAYAAARGIEFSTLLVVLMTTIFTNGILEVIVGMLVSIGIIKILKPKIRF